MTRRRLDPSPHVRDALSILSAQVRAERTTRRLTRADLAIRAGVSERTVALVESASPNVSVGNVFAVAIEAGVDLFGTGSDYALSMLANQAKGTVALLPQRVRKTPAKDDFDADF